ncbi:MAG: hypothetical protein NZ958_01350 [Bacteroidia bacterium]|nr:hypothetical protein [Bacteroidia bacterium]MDW8089310.1 hypothetical protein [Bacteroidia bacterium]
MSPRLLLGGAFLASLALFAQGTRCILVKLKASPEITSENALHPSWEEKRVTIKVPRLDWEEEFEELTDEEADPSIAECFIPQLKLISERYTYVISLACYNLIAFQNSAPYTSSPTRVQSPISFTAGLQYFLEKASEKYLKIPPKRLYAEYGTRYVPPVNTTLKYEEIDLLLNGMQLLMAEEEDDDEPPEVPSESPLEWPDDEDQKEEEN